MQTHRSLESPLAKPTFAHVSRHMDVATITMITASRSLPDACVGFTHLTLAHTLYWAERDQEDAINCAIREEPLAQHRSGYIPPSAAYLDAVRHFSQETIVMIENFPELPAEYLTPDHAKIQLAHQLYWEGRPHVRPSVLEHSV
jgi:hypothetical protein